MSRKFNGVLRSRACLKTQGHELWTAESERNDRCQTFLWGWSRQAHLRAARFPTLAFGMAAVGVRGTTLGKHTDAGSVRGQACRLLSLVHDYVHTSRPPASAESPRRWTCGCLKVAPVVRRPYQIRRGGRERPTAFCRSDLALDSHDRGNHAPSPPRTTIPAGPL